MTKRHQQKSDKQGSPMTVGAPLKLSGHDPELVKAAIRLRGETLSSLSARHGYCRAYLRNVLRSPRFNGEQIIAAFLGVDACQIWPDRYDADGTPNYAKWRVIHARKPKRRAA